MKNMRSVALMSALLGIFVVGWGCTETLDQNDYQMSDNALVSVAGDSCVTLYAGQTIDAGEVCVTVQDDDLFIEYATFDGWELTEAHAWIGQDLADMPQTRNGNPKIGNFPYNSGDIAGMTAYEFVVPLELLGGEPYVCDQEFLVAAHAALQKPTGIDDEYQTETGWGDGMPIVDRGSWATYFTVTLTCDDDDPNGGDDVCETAFAYYAVDPSLSTTFEDLIDTPRWGWSLGEFGPGSYVAEIYAGAGQSDITKGTLVGYLYIDFDQGKNAVVDYALFEGFSLNETHLYVGEEPLPRDVTGDYTVAPGQYPYIHDLDDEADIDSDSYTVGDLTSSIYVVAHAVVCGEYPESAE